MEQALHRVWARRGWVAWLLVPLSLAYRTLLALRRTLYRLGLLEAASVPVPVIVVGNVIAGGAGKTPVVMALVQYLQQRGLHPGVVSRGYGRSLTGCREVLPQSLMHEVGDEALLIQHRCHVPVFVAERRIQAAQALLERHPRTDVLLCDDGLQHLALHRDIDICVFDQRGLGNGWVLPAGPLREPWPRAVDLVLHPPTTTEPSGYTVQRELAAYALQREGSRLTLSELSNRRLIAVAGIAQPQQFFAMLRERGLVLAQSIAVPDHFSFLGWSCPVQQGDTLLCTEKDAVKLWPIYPDALAVPLTLTLDPGFLAALDAKLAAALAQKQSC